MNKTDIGVIVRLKDWDKLLSTANAIYESGMVDWCHPDFVSQKEKATNDQYFGQQYYLKNTGQNGGTRGIDINAEPAWSLSTGVGIRVAVVDDGVEDHDDLAGRVLNGFTPRNPYGNNSNGGNGRPDSSSDGHGQAVAGIIAASHNNVYIAGVAPDVKIIPINLFYGGENVSDDAAAIEYAWNPDKGNADVINNSWSYIIGPPNNADILDQEISDAVTLGRLRNGVRRGCVVVFSAGNRRPYQDVAYPGRLSNVIAVGAANRHGTVWDYSCRGSALDVVAPSGDITYTYGDIYTIDRMGANGYEPGNYISYFGGTSAAAPQVAGIAALILSRNQNLTVKQVTDAIESTARKVGGYSYTTQSGHPNGIWNNQMGYGLVNAYAAVSSVPAVVVQTSMEVQVYNYTSHYLNDVYVGLGGNVGTTHVNMYDWDFGTITPGYSAGYPTLHGYPFTALPGTTVSNLNLNVSLSGASASSLRITAAINYGTQVSSFMNGGYINMPLPNTIIPLSGQRQVVTVYIDGAIYRRIIRPDGSTYRVLDMEAAAKAGIELESAVN